MLLIQIVKVDLLLLLNVTSTVVVVFVLVMSSVATLQAISVTLFTASVRLLWFQ